jgi:hypothetical protein
MLSAAERTEVDFDELGPGDRIEVEHRVTIGTKNWSARVSGTVLRTERRRHGAHFRRFHDDAVYSDVILLRLVDGELSVVTMDEYTTLRPA